MKNRSKNIVATKKPEAVTRLREKIIALLNNNIMLVGSEGLHILAHLNPIVPKFEKFAFQSENFNRSTPNVLWVDKNEIFVTKITLSCWTYQCPKSSWREGPLACVEIPKERLLQLGMTEEQFSQLDIDNIQSFENFKHILIKVFREQILWKIGISFTKELELSPEMKFTFTIADHPAEEWWDECDRWTKDSLFRHHDFSSTPFTDTLILPIKLENGIPFDTEKYEFKLRQIADKIKFEKTYSDKKYSIIILAIGNSQLYPIDKEKISSDLMAKYGLQVEVETIERTELLTAEYFERKCKEINFKQIVQLFRDVVREYESGNASLSDINIILPFVNQLPSHSLTVEDNFYLGEFFMKYTDLTYSERRVLIFKHFMAVNNGPDEETAKRFLQYLSTPENCYKHEIDLILIHPDLTHERKVATLIKSLASAPEILKSVGLQFIFEHEVSKQEDLLPVFKFVRSSMRVALMNSVNDLIEQKNVDQAQALLEKAKSAYLYSERKPGTFFLKFKTSAVKKIDSKLDEIAKLKRSM